MSNEMLQKTIDLVSSLEVKTETQQIAKYELIEYTERLHKENQELKKQLEVGKEQYNDLVEEKENLQEQLDYLRDGEYLNQLRFERDMLQHVVDNSEVSKVDKEFIDMTHRNTELLAQQNEFIEWLEDYIDALKQQKETIEGLDIGEEHILMILEEVLEKYKEIIGVKDEKVNC